MQTQTSKNIILLIALFILPIALSAQIGRQKYVTRSGDTTIIVKNTSGLYGDDAAFLLDEKATKNYHDKHTRYQRLKEAVQETGQVANMVEVEKNETQPSTSSLSFRAAQQNIRVIQNEREAQRIAQSDRNKESTVEELAHMYKKYGEMPSYFVNGQAIDPEQAGLIPDSEVLSKSFKVGKTVTGNPNGEVWYIVTNKTLDRLKLTEESEVYYAKVTTPARVEKAKEAPAIMPSKPSRNTNVAVAPNVLKPSVKESYTRPASSERLTKEDMRKLSSSQREQLYEQEITVANLRAELERTQKEIANYSAETKQIQIAKQTQGVAPIPARERVVIPTTIEEPIAPVIKRQKLQEKEEIFSFRDSPQEKTRRERDQQQAAEKEAEKQDSPKRSVRKIKERERSRE